MFLLVDGLLSLGVERRPVVEVDSHVKNRIQSGVDVMEVARMPPFPFVIRILVGVVPYEAIACSEEVLEQGGCSEGGRPVILIKAYVIDLVVVEVYRSPGVDVREPYLGICLRLGHGYGAEILETFPFRSGKFLFLHGKGFRHRVFVYLLERDFFHRKV